MFYIGLLIIKKKTFNHLQIRQTTTRHKGTVSGDGYQLVYNKTEPSRRINIPSQSHPLKITTSK